MGKAITGKQRIYISGPVTDTYDYITRFAEAEKRLKELGYCPVNPVKIAADSPYVSEWCYKQYIDNGLELLQDCEGIYLLRGWWNSRGAKLEEHYAKVTGLKEYEQDLIDRWIHGGAEDEE